ncbi:MAG: thiosulfate oxidation carrier protein SoxY [Gemmatimonadota bacterium]
MTDEITPGRRTFLQVVGLTGAALLLDGISGAARPLSARMVRGPDEPEAPNEQVAKILKDRFGDRTIQRGHVTLDMAASTEDGRFVPVSLESDLPMSAERYVKGVYFIIDHNPDPLVFAMHLTPQIGPLAVQTRVKMRRTSWIRAIVETSDGELWADYAKVETSLNGCG